MQERWSGYGDLEREGGRGEREGGKEGSVLSAASGTEAKVFEED